MTRPLARRLPAALVVLAALAGARPADAQQAMPDAGPRALYLLPRPAETGKPLVSDRYVLATGARGGCELLLSCRVQLLGVIEKNGAVMLRGTAFSW